MFILDTNVVLELSRRIPHPDVLAWAYRHVSMGFYVTTVTEAEVRVGIAIMPHGKRRETLAATVERAFRTFFAQRILFFDSAAAHAYAIIAADRRAAGRPISQFDCQIAAIARSRGAAIATRDVDGFSGTGIEVINPWTDA